MVEKQLIDIMIATPQKAYNFICDHYSEFSKEKLAEVIKELLFALRGDVEFICYAGENLESDWYYDIGEDT